MEDIKTQLINRLKEANNVLVAVTNNPSVDQLAAAISLTLILNKLNKHATTVFSGAIPPVIEFLKPEKTIEKNTDSLRDFIISLDKTKADKLRYKIEDQFVKIFITPYHTSISEKDLVFSQGDFNVDVVLGLGVQQREELDQAITSHGRILHDATVAIITTDPPSTLGSINLSDKNSSSLCEIIVGILPLLSKDNILDDQISTALLTGIVAETQRFSNQKTTSNTMTVSSKLLAAGANQQLVAQELTPKEEPKPEPEPPTPSEPETPPAPQPEPPTPSEPPKDDSGTLQIQHEPVNEDGLAQVLIDEQGTLKTLEDNPPAEDPAPETPPAPQPEPLVQQEPESETNNGGNHALISTTNLPPVSDNDDPDDAPVTTPPDAATLDELTANLPEINGAPEAQAGDHDVNGLSSAELAAGGSSKLVIQPPPQPHLRGLNFDDPSGNVTLDDPSSDTNLDNIRSSVSAALDSTAAGPQPPIQALNANPVDLNLNHENESSNGSDDASGPPPPLPPPIIPQQNDSI